jgi:hypothetical protein
MSAAKLIDLLLACAQKHHDVTELYTDSVYWIQREDIITFFLTAKFCDRITRSILTLVDLDLLVKIANSKLAADIKRVRADNEHMCSDSN